MEPNKNQQITYCLLTNMNIKEAPMALVAVKAAGIKNYAFSKTAFDCFGQVIPDDYALYIDELTPPKEIEMYYQAYRYARHSRAEREGEK